MITSNKEYRARKNARIGFYVSAVSVLILMGFAILVYNIPAYIYTGPGTIKFLISLPLFLLIPVIGMLIGRAFAVRSSKVLGRDPKFKWERLLNNFSRIAGALAFVPLILLCLLAILFLMVSC